MGTNCVCLLTDFFFNSYEADDFIHELHRMNKKNLALFFNFPVRYKDDVRPLLLLKNSKFFYHIERIYKTELDIKFTTNTVKSASYFDLHLEIDNEGRLRAKIMLHDNGELPISTHTRM